MTTLGCMVVTYMVVTYDSVEIWKRFELVLCLRHDDSWIYTENIYAPSLQRCRPYPCQFETSYIMHGKLTVFLGVVDDLRHSQIRLKQVRILSLNQNRLTCVTCLKLALPQLWKNPVPTFIRCANLRFLWLLISNTSRKRYSLWGEGGLLICCHAKPNFDCERQFIITHLLLHHVLPDADMHSPNLHTATPSEFWIGRVQLVRQVNWCGKIHVQGIV